MGETLVTGHCAVGVVRGQRTDTGSRPKLVRITYERDDERGEAVVFCKCGSYHVEDVFSDTVRFTRQNGRALRVDGVIDAEPVTEDS